MPVSPDKLAALIMALKAMAEEEMMPPASELVRLAEAIDEARIGVAQLHPIHTTVQ
jgi:hypothetical protein